MNPVDRILWEAEADGWVYDREVYAAVVLVVSVDVLMFSSFAVGEVPPAKDWRRATSLLLTLPTEVAVAYFRWVAEESDQTFSAMLRWIQD